MAKNRADSRRHAYLTKRILIRSARAAGIKASKTAMEFMGYVVISENGWVIKKYADGRIEKIEPIVSSENLQLVFD